VDDASTGDRLGEHADHDAEHGRTAIEEFNCFELIEMDLLLGAVLKPLFVGWSVGHGSDRWVEEMKPKMGKIGTQRDLGARSLGRLST
jgi:hypothetical protein